MKLELKHITPYLPYGLKVQYTGVINGKEKSEYNKTEPITYIDDILSLEWANNFPKDVHGLKIAPIKKVSFWKERTILEVGIKSHGLKKLQISKWYNDDFKLVLRPISDYEDINSQAMSEMNLDVQTMIEISELGYSYRCLQNVSYGTIQVMAHNHIDFQNLIKEGLAIDINTL